jgi:hypothetical protein
MAAGAVAIALSSATEREHSSWQDAADREGQRYGVEGEYVRAGMEGRAYDAGTNRRTILDWLLIFSTTALFVILAAIVKFPHIDIGLGWVLTLAAAMIALLAACGLALWRKTQFR